MLEMFFPHFLYISTHISLVFLFEGSAKAEIGQSEKN